MLEQVLAHINNWFVVEKHTGRFTIENGSITLPFLKNNQYFRVFGSVFNDGLHVYPDNGLTEETFDGVIWSLAVPRALIDLSEEIREWDEKNSVVGPYQSETFDGYSYTRATNANGQAITWRDVFRGKLNRWRKI